MAFIEYKGFDHAFKYSGPWLYWLIGFYLCLPFIAYILLPTLCQKRKFTNKKAATLFVLGDLGHSPRMCYHAKSLSKLDYYVNLCGYVETQPSNDIIDDVNIDIQPIPVIRNTLNLPFILFAAEKIILQCVQLFKLLFKCRSVDFIIIQNPPSIPILLIALIYRHFFSKNTKIIIDWHNLNYSILNLKYNNENHLLVRTLKLYEEKIGKMADFHFTVTSQMKQFLVGSLGFPKNKIFILHDRPGEMFQTLEASQLTKEEILNNHQVFEDIKDVSNYKILVSSTSFTPDEDFNILLDALKNYDDDKSSQLPPILLIVTGKGPLKQQFIQKVKDLKFSENLIIKTAWLSYEDYPIILSTADLAVSLHTSSSGIDLPMKIVDFFGCGVPVITLNFPAIGELVHDKVNGLIITESEKLPISSHMYKYLKECFTNEKLLTTLRNGATKESTLRWDENWTSSVGELFH